MIIPATHNEIEQIYLAAEAKQSRSICITACHSGDGVTSVATALAERYLLAGQSALLVDLNLFRSGFQLASLPYQPNEHHIAWLEPIEGGQLFIGIAKPTEQSLIVNYRNPLYLQKMIETWLQEFDHVIVDTSPLLQVNQGNISTQCVASVCQHTLLVILGAHTSETHLSNAIEILNRSNTELIGCVMNCQYQPSLAEEMVRELNRVTWLPKRWRDKWSQRLLNHELLTLIA